MVLLGGAPERLGRRLQPVLRLDRWRTSRHLAGEFPGCEVASWLATKCARVIVEADTLAVEQADEADEGRSTLLRGLRSRGRAALEVNEGRRASPAVLSSTIT